MTIVALVLGINILVWVPMLLWIRHRARAAATTLEDELGGDPTRMAAMVNFFGRLSAGRGQVRGNGNLALTADELVFVQWVPKRTLRIPRRDIVAVETPRSFLGKSQGVQLLCVHWRSEDGDDQAAWRVRELDRWVAAIRVQSR